MDPAAHRLGSALCIASAIAFGAMAIFGKLAYDAGVGILTLLFVRFSIAAPVLWLGALQGAERRLRRRDRAGRCWPRSRSAPSATRCRPGCTSPRSRAWTPRCSRCCSTRSPRWSPWRRSRSAARPPAAAATGALLVSSGGLALVLLGAGAGTFDWLGAALGLGAALTYTAYILVSDRVGGELRALPLSALITTGAAITFGLACAASGSFDTGFASEGWLWLAAIAIVSTVTPIALFFAGLRRVGPVDGVDPLDARAADDRRARVRGLRRDAVGGPAGRRRARARRRRLRCSAARAPPSRCPPSRPRPSSPCPWPSARCAAAAGSRARPARRPRARGCARARR